MKVVVTGATGNVGSAVMRRLSEDPAVDALVGVARRLPSSGPPTVQWVAADVALDDLDPFIADADAVVHLAWQIQPAHDVMALRRTNVNGSRRVFEAVSRNRVPTLVYASSVGVYGPGAAGTTVSEDWPADGVVSSSYSRHKAEVEALIGTMAWPGTRVVSLRPALVFQRRAATEIHALFLGRLVPRIIFRPGRLPLVPHLPGLSFQVVHADDLAGAFHAAVMRDVEGPFNVATSPVVDTLRLSRVVGAHPLGLPPALVRGGVDLSFRMRLQPTSVGWFDMAMQTPLMDTGRARHHLGWEPGHDAESTITELLEGISDGARDESAPLAGHVNYVSSRPGRADRRRPFVWMISSGRNGQRL